jgi:hypothetical protein
MGEAGISILLLLLEIRMTVRFILCWSLFPIAFGQTPINNPAKEITDAYDRAYQRAVQTRMMQERMELERRRLEMERAVQEERLRQMRLQNEQIQAETQRLNQSKQYKALPAVNPNAASEAIKDRELRLALSAMLQRHDDFDKYAERMAVIADLLRPAETGELSIMDYLESLYVVAKYTNIDKTAVVSHVKDQ